MIRLYHRPDCPFCWKVRIVLHELEAPFEEVPVALGESRPEVMALNPNGTVPVLVMEDGQAIWESAAMAEYLVERFGDAAPDLPLLSGTAADKARIRQMHIFSDGPVGRALFPVIRARRSRPDQDSEDEIFRQAQRAWSRCRAVLERELQGRIYFGGTRFSLADCALLPRFELAEIYGLAPGGEFPWLRDWQVRCRQRPAVIAARPEKFPGIDDLVNSPPEAR